MIIVLGVAGSGKSTQSRMLAARENMVWISMGELLRNVITDDRKELMLAGKVLDEQETIAILDNKLKALGDKQEFILDGFPRGLSQASWLIEQNRLGRYDIRAVVHLKADKVIVRQRLLARARQDDTEQAINERFYEYDHVIKPIIDTMQANNIPIVEVDAQKQPDDVFADVLSGLSAAGVAV